MTSLVLFAAALVFGIDRAEAGITGASMSAPAASPRTKIRRMGGFLRCPRNSGDGQRPKSARVPSLEQGLWKGSRSMAKTFKPGNGYSRKDWDAVSDNPKLSAAQMSKARPFAEALPDLAASIRRGPLIRISSRPGSSRPSTSWSPKTKK
jgi:hypothetical protein